MLFKKGKTFSFLKTNNYPNNYPSGMRVSPQRRCIFAPTMGSCAIGVWHSGPVLPRARARGALAQVWASVPSRKLSRLPCQLMPASKTKRQPASRMTPFLRGAIYGLFLAGYTYRGMRIHDRACLHRCPSPGMLRRPSVTWFMTYLERWDAKLHG